MAAQPASFDVSGVKTSLASAFGARDFAAVASLMRQAQSDSLCAAYAAQLFVEHEGSSNRSSSEHRLFSQRAAAAGVVDALLAALVRYGRRETPDVHVLRSSLGALAMLCRDQGDIITSTAGPTTSSLISRLVVVLLRAHLSDAVLAARACRLFYYLTPRAHAETASAHFLCVVAVALTHVSDPAVVGWAFSWLCSVISPELLTAHIDAVHSNVIPCVLEALNMHRSVVRVAERGCGILAQVCQLPESSQKAYSMGALDALLPVLNDETANLETLRNACQASARMVRNLSPLVRRSRLETRHFTHACTRMLIRTCPLRFRKGDLDVDVEIALFSLLQLVNESVPDAIQAVHDGALPYVRHVLAITGPSDPKAREYGRPLLTCLLDAERAINDVDAAATAADAAALAAADAAAAELLAEEEAERAAQSRAAAKRARKKKRAGRGAAAGDDAGLSAASSPGSAQPDTDAAMPGAAAAPPEPEPTRAALSQPSRSVAATSAPTLPPQPPRRAVPRPYQPPMQPAAPQAVAAATPDSHAAAASLLPQLAGLALNAGAAQEAMPAAMAPRAWRECCVCLDEVAAADLWILLPCAHRCVCAACAEELMAGPAPARRYPKCRQMLGAVSRVFED